jgi:hypothetical protein
MDRNEINDIGRQLTQEDYENLEETVRRHHDYLIKMLDVIRDLDDAVRRLERGQPPRGVAARY